MKNISWRSACLATFGILLLAVIGAVAVPVSPLQTFRSGLMADFFYKCSGAFGFYTQDVADSIALTKAATSANTASAIVKRDGDGNFSAGTITANLTGNASGSAGSCTGNAATATTAGKSTNLVGGNNTTLLGSIPYQSNTDTTTLLSPNTTTTKKYLCETGDGTNGAAPVWDPPALSFIGNGSAQYQLPVTGTTPFAPAWTAATGTGSPVLADSPTFTTAVTVGTTNAGANETINATEGAEMCPALEAANWTATGSAWTAGGGQLVCTATTGSITPSGTFNISAGKYYKITYTVSVSNNIPYFTIGGGITQTIAQGTFTTYVYATSTLKIVLQSNNTGTCTITALSVKELTLGDLTLYGKIKAGGGLFALNGAKAISWDPSGQFIGIGSASNFSNTVECYVNGEIQATVGIYAPYISNAAETSKITFNGANLFTLGNSAADNSAVVQTLKGSASATDVAGSSVAIQSGRGTGATYGSVKLNPDGGNVNIGVPAVTSYKLNIAGGIHLSNGANIDFGNGNMRIQDGSSSYYIGIIGYNGSTIAEKFRFTGVGKLGVMTTAPDKQVEINSSDGNCLRLTYNDADGSAAYYSDFNTSAAGNLTITPSGTYAEVAKLLVKKTTAGITASTTQTQGQGALTANVNQISVCANANDTVTLPSAVGGYQITIINSGANTLQIFPASGDNAGVGVDTAVTLATGKTAIFTAYDATNWTIISN